MFLPMPGVIPFHARVVPAKCRARVSTPDIPTQTTRMLILVG